MNATYTENDTRHIQFVTLIMLTLHTNYAHNGRREWIKKKLKKTYVTANMHHARTHKCTCVHAHIHTCTHAHTCTNTHMYTYTHVHSHTYTHMHRSCGHDTVCKEVKVPNGFSPSPPLLPPHLLSLPTFSPSPPSLPPHPLSLSLHQCLNKYCYNDSMNKDCYVSILR